MKKVYCTHAKFSKNKIYLKLCRVELNLSASPIQTAPILVIIFPPILQVTSHRRKNDFFFRIQSYTRPNVKVLKEKKRKSFVIHSRTQFIISLFPFTFEHQYCPLLNNQTLIFVTCYCILMKMRFLKLHPKLNCFHIG